MRKTDRSMFATMLYALGETFNETVSEGRASIYFRALQDLSLHDVERAMNAHVRASQWFPKPAELLAAAHGATEDHGELAWASVQAEVRRVGWTGTPAWSDPLAERAALRLFGSWRGLCEQLPRSGPELLGLRKQFLALYGALARQDAGGVLPPSRQEAQTRLEDLKLQLEKRKLPSEGL